MANPHDDESREPVTEPFDAASARDADDAPSAAADETVVMPAEADAGNATQRRAAAADVLTSIGFQDWGSAATVRRRRGTFLRSGITKLVRMRRSRGAETETQAAPLAATEPETEQLIDIADAERDEAAQVRREEETGELGVVGAAQAAHKPPRYADRFRNPPPPPGTRDIRSKVAAANDRYVRDGEASASAPRGFRTTIFRRRVSKDSSGTGPPASGSPRVPAVTGTTHTMVAASEPETARRRLARQYQQTIALVILLASLLIIGLVALVSHASNRTTDRTASADLSAGAAGAGDAAPANTAQPGEAVLLPTQAVSDGANAATAAGKAAASSVAAANRTAAAAASASRKAAATPAARGGVGACPVAAGLLAPRDVTVAVYNAGSVKGLAKTTAQRLQQRGFGVAGRTTNAPAGTVVVSSAIIRSGPDGTVAAKTVGSQAAGEVTYLTDSRSGTGVDLILGTTFSLRPASPGTCG